MCIASAYAFHVDWQAYHRASHTPSRALGEIAAKDQPKLLIPYDLTDPGVSGGELVGEVRAAYHGRLEVGRGLAV